MKATIHVVPLGLGINNLFYIGEKMENTILKCLLIAVTLALPATVNAAPRSFDAITVDFDGMMTSATSIEIGAENDINIGSISGGGQAGKGTFKTLTIKKLADGTSNDLLTKVFTGGNFNEATIIAGNVKLVLSLVLITSFDFAAKECPANNSSCIPQEETIVIQFGQLDYAVLD